MDNKYPGRVVERAIRKVAIRTQTGCWEWSGYKASNGYGRVHLSAQKTIPAHRMTYEQYRGRIPDGLQLDHLCRNRCCVNPWHLEPVTGRENTLRGVGPSARAAMASHCPSGHAYDQDNTIVRRDGSRVCRECNRERNRNYRAVHGEKWNAAKRRARAGRNDT